MHGDITWQEDPTHTVSYLGVLQQALRDLSAWVEQGITPPATTTYTIDNGQVVVPATAAERKRIQPVVTVQANGGTHAEVEVGESVTFTAEIEVPPHTGTVVDAAWDFEGVGTFPVPGDWISVDETTSRVTLETTYAFSAPETYFPALRAASERQGDAQTPYARIQNLGRVRVVVR